MKKNKGFTLIELLAVIVILAVLMVIAVPKILNVIENSRNSAANSSIKLIKDGIKTNVAAAELTTNPFTKTDGCYLFDFDTPNANVNNLDIDNKEKAGGSIKLCDGVFSDDTLTFDGSTGKEVTTTTEEVEMLIENFNYYTSGRDSWQSQYDGWVFTGTSWANSLTTYTYKNKITVRKGESYKISTDIGLDHNYTDGSKLADCYIGISTTTGATEEDYVDYEVHEIKKYTSSNSIVADQERYEDEFIINTPGEYYIKMFVRHTDYYSNTAYASIHSLTIEKTTQK